MKLVDLARDTGERLSQSREEIAVACSLWEEKTNGKEVLEIPESDFTKAFKELLLVESKARAIVQSAFCLRERIASVRIKLEDSIKEERKRKERDFEEREGVKQYFFLFFCYKKAVFVLK